MKKIFIMALNIALAGSMCSCSDFLDREPKNTVDPETTVDEDVAVSMANACYRTLQSSNMYNQRLWTLDIVAGNSIVGAGGGTDGIETVQASNFTTQSDNGMALYMWRSPWVGIGQCNILINALEDKNPEKGTILGRSLGEAYFLRAHYYFILVRLYGGVPLRLKPFNPGESTDIARASVDEVYKQIIEDTNRAAELLPAKSQLDDDNLGRATKDAAYTMLADIYLTLAPDNNEYYQKVVSLCDDVTALGYDLSQCTYESNFDATINNGPESIFEVQFSGNTEYDFWGNNPQSSWLSTFMGPRNSNFVAGSYGWNQPTEEFMSQYEEGDKRKDLTVLYDGCPDFDGMTYKSSYSTTGYNVRKFLVSKSVSPEYNTNPANFVVYRYADVLLMKAEALNNLGKTEQAIPLINEVRKVHGNMPPMQGTSQAAVQAQIEHERMIEFPLENFRWYDLRRWGKTAEALKAAGRTGFDNSRLFYPIPLTEENSNPLAKK